MSHMSHCTQHTMYKFFCFKIEIKTKADLYMPCESNDPLHQVDLSEYSSFMQVWELFEYFLNCQNTSLDGYDRFDVHKQQSYVLWKKDCLIINLISLHLNWIEAWFSDKDHVYIFKMCWRHSNKIWIVQANFSTPCITAEIKKSILLSATFNREFTVFFTLLDNWQLAITLLSISFWGIKSSFVHLRQDNFKHPILRQ